MDMSTACFPGALLAGALYGAGPCNIACMPYLGPVFLGGSDTRDSLRIISFFSAGRLTGYTGLGLAAGAAGQALEGLLSSPVAGWILGASAIALGLVTLRSKIGSVACSPGGPGPWRRARGGGLFAMGIGMTLNPCAPLNSILMACALSGGGWNGALLGLGFGLGAALGPALFFGGVMAGFGREVAGNLGQIIGPFRTGSGLFLIMLGAATFAGLVAP